VNENDPLLNYFNPPVAAEKPAVITVGHEVTVSSRQIALEISIVRGQRVLHLTYDRDGDLTILLSRRDRPLDESRAWCCEHDGIDADVIKTIKSREESAALICQFLKEM
jgi:hypothetical protein